MNDNWIIYTIVAGLSSVGFNFVNRYVLKDGHDSSSYSWWFEFFRLLIFLPFTIFSFYLIFTLHNLVLFVLIGFVEFLSVYFYMKMHANTDLSISSVLSQARLIWVPILALIFLSEKLDVRSYLGIVVIIAGQVLITLPKKSKFKFTFDKGVVIALISSFFVAVNNVIGKEASGIFPLQLTTVAMAVPSLFLFPTLMRGGINRIIILGKIKWKVILLASLFNAVANVFILSALKLSEVGRVMAVFQSVMICQVFIGILFLGENRSIIKKITGAGIVLVGVYLLI
jgi:drug/metabolite transporter (DMT)-like permease